MEISARTEDTSVLANTTSEVMRLIERNEKAIESCFDQLKALDSRLEQVTAPQIPMEQASKNTPRESFESPLALALDHQQQRLIDLEESIGRLFHRVRI